MKYNKIQLVSRSVRRKEIRTNKSQYSKRKTCLFCPRIRGIIRKYGIHCCRNCFKANSSQLGFSTYYR